MIYENAGVFFIENNNACFLVMFISEMAELNQSSKDTGAQVFAGTEAKPAIAFPPVITAQWEEQVLNIII